MGVVEGRKRNEKHSFHEVPDFLKTWEFNFSTRVGWGEEAVYESSERKPGWRFTARVPMGGTRKDFVRSRLGFLLIFGGLRDPILRVFSRLLLLIVFGSESGCPKPEN